MRRHLALVTATVLAVAILTVSAGDLDPPGTPAPTMKTLQEIEPRVPILLADIPLEITAPGSYYLAEDIAATVATTPAGCGIEIAADNVSLDLMGKSLVAGQGTAICASGTRHNLLVRNGMVAEWTSHGVDLDLASSSVVVDVLAYKNGGSGVRVGLNGRLEGCEAEDNAINGFRMSDGSVASHCTARLNGEEGFSASNSCTISDSTATRNKDDGILMLGYGTILNCVVDKNRNDGIQVAQGCQVIGNTSTRNDFNTSGAGSGIRVTSNGNRIENNHVAQNAIGIELILDASDNVIANNTTNDNATLGITIASGGNHLLNNISTDGDSYAAGNVEHDQATLAAQAADTTAQAAVDAAEAADVTAQSAVTAAHAAKLEAIAAQDSRTPIDSLPFTIHTPGSYYLTQSLQHNSTDHGITIMADDVTLDLMGFTLTGTSATLNAIFVNGAQSNIAVSDGTLRGWGSSGIAASGASARIERIRSHSNSGAGIAIGPGSIVTHSVAEGNGGNGIDAGAGSVVADCVVKNNAAGLVLHQGATVTHCSVTDNVTQGIDATSGCHIVQCTVHGNGTYGIDLGSGATVTGSTASFNGTHGIISENNSLIADNLCDQNGGSGVLVAGSGNRIEGNNLTDNDTGLEVRLGGNLIIKNSARGNGPNYDVDAGNHWAHSNDPTTAGPWDNLTY